MIRLEHRKLFKSNGLIDSFVLYGKPMDYREFAKWVRSAIRDRIAHRLGTESKIAIQVLVEPNQAGLFTALQNDSDFYASMKDWEERDTLRVIGSSATLSELAAFLEDLAGRGEGYSYISEFSDRLAYSAESPEWRLHVLAG
jgi:hypothetical protein